MTTVFTSRDPGVFPTPELRIEVLQAAPGPVDCVAHEWPSDGLADRVQDHLTERWGLDPVSICGPCLSRAFADSRKR